MRGKLLFQLTLSALSFMVNFIACSTTLPCHHHAVSYITTPELPAGSTFAVWGTNISDGVYIYME